VPAEIAMARPRAEGDMALRPAVSRTSPSPSAGADQLTAALVPLRLQMEEAAAAAVRPEQSPLTH